MRDHDSNLPPLPLLEALRQPRRPQLHDKPVRDLLAKWKRLGRPITFDEVNELVDIVVPGARIDLEQIDRIVAAVEAAGIRIARDTPRTDWDTYDSRMRAAGIGSYQLTAEAMADLSWHVAAKKYQLTPDQTAVLRRNPRKMAAVVQAYKDRMAAAGTPVPEPPEWAQRLERKWAAEDQLVPEVGADAVGSEEETHLGDFIGDEGTWPSGAVLHVKPDFGRHIERKGKKA